MKIDEILKKVSELDDESKVSFCIGCNFVSNRFDHEDIHQYEEGDCATDLAYIIYSWIASAIIFKAQTKEKKEAGHAALKETLSRLNADNLNQCLEELDNFLNSKKKLTMNDLVRILLPSACLDLKNSYSSKEIERAASKKQAMIANQVVLFSRSLYHSFLCQKDMNAEEIQPDFKALDNGMFLYQGKTLYIPTWQNAFTLNGYRKVIENGIKKLVSLPANDIEAVAVIYLVKDIIGIYKLNQ